MSTHEKAKERGFTDEEIKLMMDLYGKVLSRKEFEMRKSRFASDASDVRYGADGVLEIG